MNAQQFQLALSQCVQQALASQQTSPAEVFGILELTKLDLHAHILRMQTQSQPPNIIPVKRMPEGGG